MDCITPETARFITWMAKTDGTLYSDGTREEIAFTTSAYIMDMAEEGRNRCRLDYMDEHSAIVAMNLFRAQGFKASVPEDEDTTVVQFEW